MTTKTKKTLLAYYPVIGLFAVLAALILIKQYLFQ